MDKQESKSVEIRRMMRSKPLRIKAMLGRVEWASKLFDEIKPKGKVTGVEVGFWKGDFGQLMLQKNERLHWIGVDPYFEYGKKRRKQPVWDAIFGRVMDKMNPFGKRFRMIRKPSHEGVKSITRKVDFIFIDGNHNLDFVYKDILLYEPKLKKGGIMAGHDYSHRCGQAVDDYVKEFGREMLVDTSFDPCGCFWWKV
jgi:hypothetical protein